MKTDVQWLVSLSGAMTGTEICEHIRAIQADALRHAASMCRRTGITARDTVSFGMLSAMGDAIEAEADKLTKDP